MLVNKQMWHQFPFSLIPFVLESEKNWAIEEIEKKTSDSHYLQMFSILLLFSEVRIFFWNSVNWSFFLGFWNGWHQIVRKSDPLISRYQNDFVSTTLRGRSPRTQNFQHTPKKCWYVSWGALPLPLMWWIPICFGIWI